MFVQLCPRICAVVSLALVLTGCQVRFGPPKTDTGSGPAGGTGGFPAAPPGGAPFAVITEMNTPEAQAIKSIGGRVVFDPTTALTSPGVKVWLNKETITDADLVKLQPLQNVRFVSISASKVTDNGLKQIAGYFPALEGLELGNSLITDAGLETVKTLTKLRRLTMTSKATDAGFARLAGLTELRELDLSLNLSDLSLATAGNFTKLERLSLFGNYTDRGFEHLEGLTELRELSTFGTKVQGHGLKNLSGATKMNRVSLTSGPTDGKNLVYLKEFKELKSVSLFAAGNVHDDDLQHLSTLTSLVSLDLRSTAVTDKGLPHLYGLTNLQFLSINGSKITPAGVAQLKQALPKVNAS